MSLFAPLLASPLSSFTRADDMLQRRVQLVSVLLSDRRAAKGFQSALKLLIDNVRVDLRGG